MGEDGWEAAFASSQTGKGLRLESAAALVQFSTHVRARDAVVCNVETFEVKNGAEVCRLDLSIYQGGREDWERPIAERIRRSESELQEVLALIGEEGINCVFYVWSDDL